MAISATYTELTTFAVMIYADFHPQQEQTYDEAKRSNLVNKLVNFQRRSGDRHLFAIIHEAVRASILCCEFRCGLRSFPPIDNRNWGLVSTHEPNDTKKMTATIQEALNLQQKYWQPRLRLHGLQVLASLAGYPEYRVLLQRFAPQIQDAITESLFNCGEDLQVMAAFLRHQLQNNGVFLTLNVHDLARQMEQADTCHFANHNAFCQLGLRLALRFLLFAPPALDAPAEVPAEDPDVADFMSSEDDEELEDNETIGLPDESTDEEDYDPVETVEEEEQRCGKQPTQDDIGFIDPVDEPDGDEEYKPEEDQDDGFDSDDSASSEEETI